MSQVIIKAIRDYFLDCPLLHDGIMNVDYIDENIGYSINALPSEPYYKLYVDGDGIRQFYFAIESREAYGEDVLNNITNSGFQQKLEEWINENNENGILPVLDDYTPIRIDVTYTGYMQYADPMYGNYQIQCRLLYEKEI